jgi:aldehyde:ferredoxin oxidoreductase
MALPGYMDKMARVNLSKKTVNYEPIPPDWAKKYIGARGLGVLLPRSRARSILGPANLLLI